MSEVGAIIINIIHNRYQMFYSSLTFFKLRLTQYAQFFPGM